MVDLKKLEEISRKYIGRKNGHDFKREIRNEISIPLMFRQLKGSTKSESEKIENSLKNEIKNGNN
ncbi:MAG: hypothetical protein ACYC3B_02990 [Sedimentisphaerales bacterium]